MSSPHKQYLGRWISKTEWHPFSVFPHPRNAGESAIYINSVGDWTKLLHESVSEGTTRPVWVQGPFVSPFDAGVGFDNIMLVVTGIGITPALATIAFYKGERNIPLVWIVRDAGKFK
jgi:ferric-chelate reductase